MKNDFFLSDSQSNTKSDFSLDQLQKPAAHDCRPNCALPKAVPVRYDLQERRYHGMKPLKTRMRESVWKLAIGSARPDELAP